ncbi:Histone-like protein transcription factor (CBF/NF-Y)-like protein, partial [Euroglyphus maynei]
MLETFWKREMLSVQYTTSNDFRNQELPLARIKKIMKLDEDVKYINFFIMKMISGEAPVLFAKAVEMFIAELSLRAWINTEENKRRTLQKNDISTAISKYDQFDFLIDIVPRETKPVSKKHDTHGHNTITDQDQYNYLVQIAQTPSTIHQTSTGQPIQIIQTAPNQPNQFSLSPQIIQVP